MTEIMMYDEFIKSKTINHNDLIDNYQDGRKYLNETEFDIISYNTQKQIKFSKVDVLDVDKNNNYIYTYTFEKCNGDVINNINFVSSNKNIKMIFILGDEDYDNINTYIHILASYHKLQLKFIFTEKPTMNDEICLYYRNYLLNDVDIYQLVNCQIVETDTNVYLSGMIGRNEKFNEIDIRIKHLNEAKIRAQYYESIQENK